MSFAGNKIAELALQFSRSRVTVRWTEAKRPVRKWWPSRGRVGNGRITKFICLSAGSPTDPEGRGVVQLT